MSEPKTWKAGDEAWFVLGVSVFKETVGFVDDAAGLVGIGADDTEAIDWHEARLVFTTESEATLASAEAIVERRRRALDQAAAWLRLAEERLAALKAVGS